MTISQDRITQVVSALKDYEPERIILFGSQARGNADQYSDLDIVIIKETDERFLDRLETVYELVQPRFAMDVLVYTPQEFTEMQERGNSFVEMLLREGVVVYERSHS
ncbi:MAG TPA: nucleotidyltransferase domain-containing protein [Anaerolineae bacterium]|nr:nucleotidyltransferase domain-containing protein [Anaerolineae bacterium]